MEVDINRARKATHVLAIVNGIVEEVYNPVDWKYTEAPEYIGRCEFQGVEDEHTTYIGKDVTAFYDKSQNPLKYINMWQHQTEQKINYYCPLNNKSVQ